MRNLMFVFCAIFLCSCADYQYIRGAKQASEAHFTGQNVNMNGIERRFDKQYSKTILEECEIVEIFSDEEPIVYAYQGLMFKFNRDILVREFLGVNYFFTIAMYDDDTWKLVEIKHPLLKQYPNTE